jgi:hypothetical protein
MHIRAIAATALALLLTGCAADIQTVAVKTEIAPAPSACRSAPKSPPVLPDRDMKGRELAQAYARLQRQYQSQAARYRLCQGYVRRLTTR